MNALCGMAAMPGYAAPSGTELGVDVEDAVTPPRLVGNVVPDYPAGFDRRGEHGDVYLLVKIGLTGEVLEVAVEKGPTAFHQVAIKAASRMQFEPALLDGVPVVVTTRVWFHFAPAESTGDGVLEVVVYSHNEDKKDTHARTTLDANDLEKTVGVNLAETLSQVPGVTIASGTTSASKPIIRGQHERRLLVLFDGVRHESQKWGPDHATEIDPYAAGSISVVRGAAGARYGADAIGGVILVKPPDMREDIGFSGHSVGAIFSNGIKPYGAFRFDLVPESMSRLSFRIEGNYEKSASLQTPTYTLGNTASTVWNAGFTVEHRPSWGTLRLNAHHYDMESGVFYGLISSSPSEFEEQLDASRPLNADLWSTSYSVDRPYQAVTHDIITARAEVVGELGTLEATYAYQHNRRMEFEQVRSSVTGPQFDFLLRTNTVNLFYKHPDKALSFATARGGIGVEGMFQENLYDGISLIPNYRSLSGSVFGFERLVFERLELEAGARYDVMGRTAYLSAYDYSDHESNGSLSEQDCDVDSERAVCSAAYDAVSVSLGAVVPIMSELLDLKLDTSSASRFPNVDEMYMLGYAPTFPVYAIGSPALDIEMAVAASATLVLDSNWLQAEWAAHASYVDNYIYFAPAIGEDGTPAYTATIKGTFPLYSYTPIQAMLYGFDGFVRVDSDTTFFAEAMPSVVRAMDVDTQTGLVGTPADRVDFVLGARLTDVTFAKNSEVGIHLDLVSKQSSVADNQDLAPAPDAYALLGFTARTMWSVGERKLRMTVDVKNVLNTVYRDYTSLMRYYADGLGRDVQVRFASDF